MTWQISDVPRSIHRIMHLHHKKKEEKRIITDGMIVEILLAVQMIYLTKIINRKIDFKIFYFKI